MQVFYCFLRYCFFCHFYIFCLIFYIYIGNLPFQLSSKELREVFEVYGNVAFAKIVRDRETKKSRGFGFVEITEEAEAQKAIENLHQSLLQERELKVSMWQDLETLKEQKSFQNKFQLFTHKHSKLYCLIVLYRLRVFVRLLFKFNSKVSKCSVQIVNQMFSL